MGYSSEEVCFVITILGRDHYKTKAKKYENK